MAIYSFYSGMDPDGKQNEAIQSAELEQLPVLPVLREMSSLRALTPAGQPGEMLSWLLHREGYGIFGLSWSEKRAVSGAVREAPCSLQYVTPGPELAMASADLGKIVNFINFQKPPASSPAPLNGWPMIESGYWFHNSTPVLTALVDGLARVATAPDDTVMLIGLPKGKKNAYAFARYTIAEMLEYLPENVRVNIRFFTGLPAAGKAADPGAGFDTAVKYGANVIFCPGEYFKQIGLYRKCISVDMDRPSAEAGAYADYITHAPGTMASLAAISGLVSGEMTYESLNRAARQAGEGRVGTVEKLREEISRKDLQIRTMGQQIEDGNRTYQQLRREHEEMKAKRAARPEEADVPSVGKTVTKRILLWLLGVAILAAGILMGSGMLKKAPEDSEEITRTKQELSAAQKTLEEKEQQLETRETELSEARAGLADQQAALEHKDSRIMELENQLESQASGADRLAEIRNMIVTDLARAFVNAGLGVSIGSDGTIVLSSSVFFDIGKSEIREEGKEILDRLIPVYLSVLLRDEYVDYLGEIMIEGHTDSTGTFESNLKLSQDRALQVMLYCLDMPSLDASSKIILKNIMTAKGRSESQLIYDSLGQEDQEASRRIEIRFRMKDEE